jgi:signal transduction histidine kinase
MGAWSCDDTLDVQDARPAARAGAAPVLVRRLPLPPVRDHPPERTVRRALRRVEGRGDQLALLISRVLAAQSEDEAIQVAIGGLAKMLRCASVSLRALDGTIGADMAADRTPRTPRAKAANAQAPKLERVSVPVVADGELLGTLVLDPRARTRGLDARAVAVAQAVAGTLAQVISHMRLRAAAAAREHEEVRRKSAFLASVAHELRTPLTCVSGHAQLLAQRLERLSSRAGGASLEESDAGWLDQAVRPLRAIQRQVARVDHLLTEILETAMLDEAALRLHLEQVDAVAVARSVVDDAQAMTRSHRLVFESPPTIQLRCDPGRLEQILYNLVANAIKYSPEGGEVRVVLRITRNQAGVPGLSVTVSDQGIGIPEGEAERMFTRFAAAEWERKSSIPGVGLGLYIGREFAARHRGTLRLLPSTGPGSRFELWLPLAGPDM